MVPQVALKYVCWEGAVFKQSLKKVGNGVGCVAKTVPECHKNRGVILKNSATLVSVPVLLLSMIITKHDY